MAFAEDVLIPAITGAVDDAMWRLEIVERLSACLGRARATALVAEWSALPGTVDQDVVVLLRQMRRRAPVVLLTNATSRLRQDLETLDIAKEFDAVISSAETRVAKPSPGAFVVAAEVLGRLAGVPMDAGKLLLIDDTPAHVAAAEALGWRTHLFTSAPSMRELLTG
ncbi:MAG TPA: HAD-IA family hydrolase [Thermomicrobiales bacterium]|nr:HAD-IA family hydrolase [Thermomicrobiales bacterium]